MSVEQIATQFSPRIDLPYRYLITGLVFLSGGVIYLLVFPESFTGHYIGSENLLVLVHTFGLGFITSIMMGAMYQLLSVVLQSPLFSERLGRLSFWVFLAGLTGMLLSLFYGYSKINITAGLLALSLLIFVVNAGLTIYSSRKMDIIIAHVIFGVLSLFFVLLLGVLMAENILRGIFSDHLALLRVHLAFAIFGWIIVTTMGFSYKLIPMFMLSHGYNEKYSSLSIYTLAPGIIIYAVSQLFSGADIFEKIAILFIIAGTVFYLLQMKEIFKSRLRKRIEPQIASTIIAKAFLFISVIILPFIYYSGIHYSSYYVLVIFLLLGFAGLYIVGMMHKIVPFLEWYNKYSPKIGREKVPLTKEMIDESLIYPTVCLWAGGVVTIALGSWFSEILVIRFGAVALLFSTCLFLWNILNVFRK